MRKRLRRLRRRYRRLRSQIARLEAAIGNKPKGATAISNRGVLFIAEFEGLPNVKNGRAYLYDDPVGYATIGYGHLVAYRPVAALSTSERKPWVNGLTKTDAMTLLRKDLKTYADGVRDLFPPLKQREFDALVSFAYNNGLGALASSTLRRKILAKAPQGEIREQFNRWVNAGGKQLPGLVRRRKAEADLYFNTPGR